ncbi:GntR family transcriptional regulator [Streptomyces sp. NPDC002088]|uniref:FadR/GntR family transcriptional regulator n=1 Tax=unclassified Streptomyces TaxID=2593676 RepID=UPI00332FB286
MSQAASGAARSRNVNQEYAVVNGSGRTSAQEIADALRERIRAGDLEAGDRLPTQAVLAEEFGVERGTVRQALAMLQHDGLLTNVTKGSPPRVAEVPAEQPQQFRAARVVLIRYLAEAFRADDVRIDAVCFTAETLLWALAEMCAAVTRGEAHPRSITVRCLLPGPGVPLPYPEPLDRPDLREPVHEQIKAQIKAQMETMNIHLSNLKRYQGVDTEVTFRPLRFVPSEKKYVLNDTLALRGDYPVGRQSYELPGVGEFDVLDVSGFNSDLFEYRQSRGGQEAAVVRATKNYFDALWDSEAPGQTLAE